MKSEPTSGELLTPQVLFRYKFMIAVIALLVILAGYFRIITQPRKYSATAVLQVRFSSEALSLPDAPSGHSALRLPLLEEEVKAHILTITDVGFIDQVVESFKPSEPDSPVEEAAVPETVEPTALELFQESAVEIVSDIRRGVYDFFDQILMNEDTIVSDRERRVFQVLGNLEVTAGDDASHLITITYSDRDPVRSSDLANAIARKFIELQKKKTRRRDINALSESVDRAAQKLVDVTGRKLKLSAEIGNVSIEAAIKNRQDKLERMRDEEAILRSGLSLVSQKVQPGWKDLPVQSTGSSGEERRVWEQYLLQLMQQQLERPENPHIPDLIEAVKGVMDSRKSERIEEMRLNIDSRLAHTQGEITKLGNDRTLFEVAPNFSALLVEEAAAHSALSRSELELANSIKFNEQLEDQNVAEHVALWKAATVPPFPEQQQRLLKFMVVLILGLFAGGAAAVGRHMVWPKRPKKGGKGAATSTTGDLEMPIIILPEEGNEELENDVEFDMSFPKDDKPSKG